MKKIKIYCSHSIRGKFGLDATPEQMEVNCKIALQFGVLLNMNIGRVDWYVPAEHEEFVGIAYQKGYLTEHQILDVDCAILDKCRALLVFDPDNYISRGMQVEIDYADSHSIPVYFTDGNDWTEIKEFVDGLGEDND